MVQLQTLRGCILEDAIPSSSRLSSSRGLPPKDVLEFVAPEFPLSCLKSAVPGQKTASQLMKLDEQGVSVTAVAAWSRRGTSVEILYLEILLVQFKVLCSVFFLSSL